MLGEFTLYKLASSATHLLRKNPASLPPNTVSTGHPTSCLNTTLHPFLAGMFVLLTLNSLWPWPPQPHRARLPHLSSLFTSLYAPAPAPDLPAAQKANSLLAVPWAQGAVPCTLPSGPSPSSAHMPLPLRSPPDSSWLKQPP